MSRPRREKKQNHTGRFAYKIFYYVAIVLIFVAWIYGFKSYFEHYDSLHPEITWAVPWVQVDTITANGVFLWNERKLTAPRAGTVKFPKGTGPVRVQRGAVVARIVSGASVHDVKAPHEGYFVAGLDGKEDGWRYSSLWPGVSEMPAVEPLKLLKEGFSVPAGGNVGKIVPQPQDLRFIGYADLVGNLGEELASDRLMVKMDALDTPSKAHVRVYDVVGHRAKLYLNMPWFPPEVILSRNYQLIIEAGETSGVVVPESAITTRDQDRGAYILRGSQSVFRKVKGRSISGARFLVTEGIRLGDAVIVNAQGAREGRVKLW